MPLLLRTVAPSKPIVSPRSAFTPPLKKRMGPIRPAIHSLSICVNPGAPLRLLARPPGHEQTPIFSHLENSLCVARPEQSIFTDSLYFGVLLAVKQGGDVCGPPQPSSFHPGIPAT